MTQRLFFFLLLFTAAGLSACSVEMIPEPTKTFTPSPTTSPPSTITPTNTATPDPCAPENIATEADKVNQLMQQFTDASLLASNTPFEQLNPAIAELQRIRREAQAQAVPACISTLQEYEIAHMNAVIDTLLGFYKGADLTDLNQTIALARQQYEQYSLELARISGWTMTPPATFPPTSPSTPAATP